jgi:class 3 adenylate cyclase
MARTHQSARAPTPLVSQILLDALRAAESCRRAGVVRRIEDQLREVDFEKYCAHVYQRVRGNSVTEDTTSLISGVRERATVIFFDLQGSTEYALGQDPEDVMMAINQMMASFVAVLRQYDARIEFRGDGFLALVRDKNNQVNAVTAALKLFQALEEFNAPLRILELPLFSARIGINSGEVFLGNVGTYDKMDYTPIGATVNLAARLQTVAEPGLPCIGSRTYEAVRARFLFKKGNPRVHSLKGIGEEKIWDVVGFA